MAARGDAHARDGARIAMAREAAGRSHLLVVAADDRAARLAERLGVAWWRPPLGTAAPLASLQWGAAAALLRAGVAVVLGDASVVWRASPFAHLSRDADVEAAQRLAGRAQPRGSVVGVSDPPMGWSAYGQTMAVPRSILRWRRCSRCTRPPPSPPRCPPRCAARSTRRRQRRRSPGSCCSRRTTRPSAPARRSACCRASATCDPNPPWSRPAPARRPPCAHCSTLRPPRPRHRRGGGGGGRRRRAPTRAARRAETDRLAELPHRLRMRPGSECDPHRSTWRRGASSCCGEACRQPERGGGAGRRRAAAAELGAAADGALPEGGRVQGRRE